MAIFNPYSPPLTPNRTASVPVSDHAYASKIPLPPSPRSSSHEALNYDSVRPSLLRITRKPVNTIPSLRPMSPFRQPLPSELLSGRRTPDRTWTAPKVTWRSYRPMSPFSEDEDDNEVDKKRERRRGPSLVKSPRPLGLAALNVHDGPALPLFDNLSVWNGEVRSEIILSAIPQPRAPTPMSPTCPANRGDDEDMRDSVFSDEDAESQFGVARTISITTVDLSSVQPPLHPLVQYPARDSPASRGSRFTEHIDVKGEAMYASTVELVGSSTSLAAAGFGDGGGEDEEEKREDEGEGEVEVKERKKKGWKEWMGWKAWKASLEKGAKWMVCCSKES